MKSTIAVVGAGPGLGLAIARRFGRADFQVALIARRTASLDAMVAHLRDAGIEAEGFVADISNEEALNNALKSAKGRFGSIDVLEFSPVPAPEGDAASFAPDALDRTTIDRLHRLIVGGAVTSVQQVLPDMKAKSGCSIFLTTSGSAHHVMPVYTPIGMVMASLRSYALCLNAVLNANNVYVATVCIGVLIRPGDPVGDPDALANRYYDLHLARTAAEAIINADIDPNLLHDRDMAERGIAWDRPTQAEA